jgi:hypothetical protein
VQKLPQLGTGFISHSTFSEAIKEHKSLGSRKGEGLIVVEKPPLSAEVAKCLGQIQIIKTHVFTEGERFKWKNCRPLSSVARKTLATRQTCRCLLP